MITHNILLSYGRPKNYIRSGVLYHWSSSHYAVTQVPNKNSNIQGRSPNVIKSDFPCHKELLLKERILSV